MSLSRRSFLKALALTSATLVAETGIAAAAKQAAPAARLAKEHRRYTGKLTFFSMNDRQIYPSPPAGWRYCNPHAVPFYSGHLIMLSEWRPGDEIITFPR